MHSVEYAPAPDRRQPIGNNTLCPDYEINAYHHVMLTFSPHSANPCLHSSNVSIHYFIDLALDTISA